MKEETQKKKVERKEGMAVLVGLLKQGVSVKIETEGYSMVPCLWPGDEVTVRPVGEGTLEEGNVVLMKVGDVFVGHRLVRRADGTMVSRGDSNFSEDTFFAEENVVGEMVTVRRLGMNVAIGRGVWSRYLRRFSPYSYKINGKIASVARKVWNLIKRNRRA